MSLADLSLGEWRTFDLPTAQRVADEAAGRVGGRVIAVETVVHLGAPLHRVRIDSTELTSDESAIHGGDGGESVCGAYGNLLGWLPLATANRNPSLVELVYGPDGEDMFEDFSTRPVLAL